MSKEWGFGVFLVSSCGFMESLGQGEYSEIVSTIFHHHQDDQEHYKCLETGVLGDFGYRDGVFVIVIPQ